MNENTREDRMSQSGRVDEKSERKAHDSDGPSTTLQPIALYIERERQVNAQRPALIGGGGRGGRPTVCAKSEPFLNFSRCIVPVDIFGADLAHVIKFEEGGKFEPASDAVHELRLHTSNHVVSSADMNDFQLRLVVQHARKIRGSWSAFADGAILKHASNRRKHLHQRSGIACIEKLGILINLLNRIAMNQERNRRGVMLFRIAVKDSKKQKKSHQSRPHFQKRE